MDETGRTDEPTADEEEVIEVETEQVAGIIALDDIVTQVSGAAAAAAQQAATGLRPASDAGTLERVSELARQLAEALSELESLDEE